MAHPRKATIDPLNDLPRKTAILEREMTTQRVAMERLKEIAVPRPHQPHDFSWATATSTTQLLRQPRND